MITAARGAIQTFVARPTHDELMVQRYIWDSCARGLAWNDRPEYALVDVYCIWIAEIFFGG